MQISMDCLSRAAIVVALIAFAFSTAGGTAPPVTEGCESHHSEDLNIYQAIRFEDYQVLPQKEKPASPIITSDYREFSTAIRRGVATGPNFAGHYTFAGWGVGSGGRCWAIVNAKNGIIGAGGCFTTAGLDAQEPKFRLNSRLLILTGAFPNKRMGVAYYEWTGRLLRELRFVPGNKLCD